jgi:rRNA maturation endonuclease Nob1
MADVGATACVVGIEKEGELEEDDVGEEGDQDDQEEGEVGKATSASESEGSEAGGQQDAEEEAGEGGSVGCSMAAVAAAFEPNTSSRVLVLTSDFPMQNVLLQVQSAAVSVWWGGL